MVSVDIIWISNFIVYVVTKAIVDLSGCWHTMMEKATMRTTVIYRVAVEKQSKELTACTISHVSQLVLYLISISEQESSKKNINFFSFC